jgi:hypothetical protein
MSYVIEKGIPIASRVCTNVKFPFEQMEVGDSFAVAKAEGKYASDAARKYGKYNGKTFATRTIGDQTRIWRRT